MAFQLPPDGGFIAPPPPSGAFNQGPTEVVSVPVATSRRGGRPAAPVRLTFEQLFPHAFDVTVTKVRFTGGALTDPAEQQQHHQQLPAFGEPSQRGQAYEEAADVYPPRGAAADPVSHPLTLVFPTRDAEHAFRNFVFSPRVVTVFIACALLVVSVVISLVTHRAVVGRDTLSVAVTVAPLVVAVAALICAAVGMGIALLRKQPKDDRSDGVVKRRTMISEFATTLVVVALAMQLVSFEAASVGPPFEPAQRSAVNASSGMVPPGQRLLSNATDAANMTTTTPPSFAPPDQATLYEGLELRLIVLLYVVRPRFLTAAPVLLITMCLFAVVAYWNALKLQPVQLGEDDPPLYLGPASVIVTLAIAIRNTYQLERRERNLFSLVVDTAEGTASLERHTRLLSVLAKRLSTDGSPLVAVIGPRSHVHDVVPPGRGIGSVMFAVFHGLANVIGESRVTTPTNIHRDLRVVDELLQRIDACRVGSGIVRGGMLGDAMWYATQVSPDKTDPVLIASHAERMCCFAMACRAAFEAFAKKRGSPTRDSAWYLVSLGLGIDCGLIGMGFVGPNRLGYAIVGAPLLRARCIAEERQEGDGRVARATVAVKSSVAESGGVAGPHRRFEFGTASTEHLVLELGYNIRVVDLLLPSEAAAGAAQPAADAGGSGGLLSLSPATGGGSDSMMTMSESLNPLNSTTGDLVYFTSLHDLDAPPAFAKQAAQRRGSQAAHEGDSRERTVLREASRRREMLMDVRIAQGGRASREFEAYASERRFELLANAAIATFLVSIVAFVAAFAVADRVSGILVGFLVLVIVASLAMIAILAALSRRRRVESEHACGLTPTTSFIVAASFQLLVVIVWTILMTHCSGAAGNASPHLCTVLVFSGCVACVELSLCMPHHVPTPYVSIVVFISALFIAPAIVLGLPIIVLYGFVVTVLLVVVYARFWSDERRLWATCRVAALAREAAEHDHDAYQRVLEYQLTSSYVERVGRFALEATAEDTEVALRLIEDPTAADDDEGNDAGGERRATSANKARKLIIRQLFGERPVHLSSNAFVVYVRVAIPQSLVDRLKSEPGRALDLACENHTESGYGECDCLSLISAYWALTAQLRAAFGALRDVECFAEASRGDDLVAIGRDFSADDGKVLRVISVLRDLHRTCSRYAAPRRVKLRAGDEDGGDDGGGGATMDGEHSGDRVPPSFDTRQAASEAWVKCGIASGVVATSIVGGRQLSSFTIGSAIDVAKFLAQTSDHSTVLIAPPVATVYSLCNLKKRQLDRTFRGALNGAYSLGLHEPWVGECIRSNKLVPPESPMESMTREVGMPS